jgi:hypothetical protein
MERGALLFGWETDRITAYGIAVSQADSRGIMQVGPEHPIGGEPPPETRYHITVSAEVAYMKFNLAWPIEAQLKRAKRLLRKLQTDFKRQHPELIVNKRERSDKYRAYLQLLDAEEAGASNDEMAALLPKDLKMRGSDLRIAVKYSLAAARRLRDGDYLFLLL